jgi:pyruvate/2-oxoglutarate dehydrogenase complex dihydrolipoamide dehydrogenase (E3) component
MSEDVDVVVVGLGPGGESLAGTLAGKGLDVVGVDERLVGGECPYYGCIPSKMMIAAASAPDPDWSAVAKRIREEATDDWDDTVAVERLERAGARFVRGRGRLTGEREVEVDGRRFRARRGVVLNTGTTPAVPPVDGLADTPYWTNRDAVRVETLPASLIVLGGGAIGAELAQAFSRFGVDVTVLEVADRILAPEEPEASRIVADAFAREGIRVLTGVQIASVRYDEGRFGVDLGDQTLHADKLLVAAGRRPNLPDLGLEAVGLDPAVKALEVEDRLRVAHRLWAIGDNTGKGALTHK